MPLNIIDYANKPLQDTAATDFFENVLKGYKMEQEPAKMKQEAAGRDLTNKQTTLANALKQKALEHYDEKFGMEKRLNEARIAKLNNKATTDIVKPNGKVANIAWVKKQLEDPNIDPAYAKQLQTALQDEQEHQESSTNRSNTLNETQAKRDATPITKKYLELKDINKGVYPETDAKIPPDVQDKLRNHLMLGLVKDTTDPLTREKLINGSNMNITLDSINPKYLTQYSGIPGKANKLADMIIESAGAGSPEYKNYRREVVKTMAAAKQLRMYLKDSIQPFAADKLEKLTNPEAWNVSPQLAKENFEFMRDLMRRETNTLVRAATDPSLYTAEGNAPKRAASTSQQAPQQFDWNKYPVAGG